MRLHILSITLLTFGYILNTHAIVLKAYDHYEHSSPPQTVNNARKGVRVISVDFQRDGPIDQDQSIVNLLSSTIKADFSSHADVYETNITFSNFSNINHVKRFKECLEYLRAEYNKRAISSYGPPASVKVTDFFNEEVQVLLKTYTLFCKEQEKKYNVAPNSSGRNNEEIPSTPVRTYEEMLFRSWIGWD